MIALHFSSLNGMPCVWAESAKLGALKDLRSALQGIGLSWKVQRTTTQKAQVWLPSIKGAWIPSSPLLGEQPDNGTAAKLKSHSVYAYPLDVEALLTLRAVAAEGNIPHSGVLFGDSIIWMRGLAAGLLKIGAEESYLPTVVFRAGQWEARWEPVSDAAMDAYMTKLAEAMPSVVRCMTQDAEEAPNLPASAVLEQLMTTSVDALVRQSQPKSRRKQKPNSIHDAWLLALTGVEAKLAWDKDQEIRQFADQLRQWRRPTDLQSKSPFRLCFQLQEPDPDGLMEAENADVDSEDAGSVIAGADVDQAPWEVTYYLQPKSDPGVLAPLSELWKPKSQTSRDIMKIGGDPTEFLLTSLGQASGLCPQVGDSLKRKYPGGFTLDSAEALQFLQEHAEGLRTAGFVVMLPSWWVGRGRANRLGIKAKARSSQSKSSGMGLGLDELLEYDLVASLHGQEIDIEELMALAALKTPLIKLRGQWTQIDPDQIKAAIKYLQKQQDRSMTGRELIQLALGAGSEVDGMPIESVEMDGALGKFFEQLSGERKFAQLRQPKGFKGKLRHYQRRGYSWLAFLRQYGFGACLADDMGLGKTVQTLALIQRDRSEGESRPVLLVCPTSVVNNWRKEAELFTPDLPVLVHHGTDRKKKAQFVKQAKKQAVVVSSYGLLHRDISFLSKVDWAGIILDEAQNIKNASTKQAKAARTLNSEYRLALTGTPVENHVGDLWSIMEFLNPGLLGSQQQFQRLYQRPIQVYGDTEAAERLRNLTQPFVLRRLKTDKKIISDLPDKVEMKDYCTLTKEQASLYKAVVDDLSETLAIQDGMTRRGMVLASLMKLKQVCNHPAQFAGDGTTIDGRSGKLERLTDILLETREMQERTLIFTQFAEMGMMLQRYLQDMFGEEVFFLHGGVSKKNRDKMVDRFQNDPQAPRIFVLSLKAGGTGLTLTQANHVIHYDRWWNPAVENQATDRVFRIGQQKNVQVHKFVVSGTLEERIDAMIEMKSGIAAQVVGTGEAWLTELSNEQLMDLIKLDKEAMGE